MMEAPDRLGSRAHQPYYDILSNLFSMPCFTMSNRNLAHTVIMVALALNFSPGASYKALRFASQPQVRDLASSLACLLLARQIHDGIVTDVRTMIDIVDLGNRNRSATVTNTLKKKDELIYSPEVIKAIAERLGFSPRARDKATEYASYMKVSDLPSLFACLIIAQKAYNADDRAGWVTYPLNKMIRKMTDMVEWNLGSQNRNHIVQQTRNKELELVVQLFSNSKHTHITSKARQRNRSPNSPT